MRTIDDNQALAISGGSFFEDVGRLVGYAHGWISGRMASEMTVPTGVDLERYRDSGVYESM